MRRKGIINTYIKQFKAGKHFLDTPKKYYTSKQLHPKVKNELIHRLRKLGIEIKILQYHPETFISCERDTYFPGYYFEEVFNAYVVIEFTKFKKKSYSKFISLSSYFNRKYGVDLITKQDFEENYLNYNDGYCNHLEIYKDHYKKLY